MPSELTESIEKLTQSVEQLKPVHPEDTSIAGHTYRAFLHVLEALSEVDTRLTTVENRIA